MELVLGPELDKEIQRLTGAQRPRGVQDAVWSNARRVLELEVHVERRDILDPHSFYHGVAQRHLPKLHLRAGHAKEALHDCRLNAEEKRWSLTIGAVVALDETRHQPLRMTAVRLFGGAKCDLPDGGRHAFDVTVEGICGGGIAIFGSSL